MAQFDWNGGSLSPEYTVFNGGLLVKDLDNPDRFIFSLFWDGYRCMIHGDQWSDNIIDAFVGTPEFLDFSGVHLVFSGRKDLVIPILESQNIDYEISMDRFVYECTEPSENIKLSPGLMEIATQEDAEILMRYCFLGDKDQHNGESSISPQTIQNMVFSGINEKSFYKWRYRGQIASICQVEISETRLPWITNFYTNPAFRNRGFGKSILIRLTRNLLEEYVGCGLVSDASFEYSNKAFISCGYQQIYKFITVKVVRPEQ